MTEFIGVAFISGKFRGSNHWQIHLNVLKAEAVVPKLIGLGYIPYCPHLITANLQGHFSDDVFLDMCLEYIRQMNPKTDIMFMLEGWQESRGAGEEYELARELGITIIGEGDYDVKE